jgi:5-methylcytosine-specific restriction endonuclease McrA
MRRALTPREKSAMVERQNGLCTLCGEPFGTERVEFEHVIPVALGNDQKPTEAVHRSCHRMKTRVDRKRIAKAFRLHKTFVLGEKKHKRKIESRGFDRAWRRKMNGQTVPRHP